MADASAFVDLLLGNSPNAAWTRRTLASDAAPVQAPAVLDYEIASALRGLVRRQVLDAAQGEQTLRDFLSLRLKRHGPRRHMSRIWELRETHTAYDASYIALAEALECPLVTTDERLARSHGHGAEIRSPETHPR